MEEGNIVEKSVGFLVLLVGVYALAVAFGIVIPLQFWLGLLIITGLITVPILQVIFGLIMAYGGYWLLEDQDAV